jgi:hypothetical protein
MKLWAIAVIGIALFVQQGCAEPRWCSVTGRGPTDNFIYPPIARAARVYGVVLGRLVFETNGNPVRFESISGPPMLSETLKGQLLAWNLKTDAKGDELCETLVIAVFKLKSMGTQLSPPSVQFEAGSVLRLVAETEPMPLFSTSDPAPLRGFKLFRAEVKWKLRRAMAALSGSH